MIEDNRKNEEFGRFEYYRIGDRPIRVVFRYEDDQIPIAADILNPNTGELVGNASLICEIDTSPFAEEITKKEFNSLCEEVMQKKYSGSD